MRSLAEFDIPSLREAITAAGLNPVHARAILRAYYAANGKPLFGEIERIGSRVSAWLEQTFTVRSAPALARTVSGDGTTKLLIGLPAGGAVETVLMPTHRADRTMGCVSSQIGCAMGCDFCASTRRGLERNLEPHEIVEQFLHLRRAAGDVGRKLTTIVFMGMGEPMHNLDHVLAAVRRIADPDLGGLGWRQVTVSTVGVVPGIDRLAEADLNVHLALSLHAADDETRSRIVPMNRRYGVMDVIEATRRYHARTGRIPTIEYCLIDGVNDSDAHAAALVELLHRDRFHVNLIPYNAIGTGLSGARYHRPPLERTTRFLAHLREGRLVAHVRDARGDDVNAACGQLRETAGSSALAVIG